MTTISHLQSKLKTTASNKQSSFLYLPWINNKRQQNQNFVLNCDSQEWKLPEYNSLKDKNLHFYFANPNIRTVLRKTGVVDEQGNITKDKKRTLFATNQKLAPISENVNPTVQRLVAPYRSNKSNKTKASLSKLSKYPSAPQKRVSLIEQYNLAPKKSQTLLLKPKVLTSTRKVQPLTKDQLEQVFAKYQIKTVNKKDKIDNHNESMTAEERSTDCKDRKSEEASPEKVQPQNEVSQDFVVKKLEFEVGKQEDELILKNEDADKVDCKEEETREESDDNMESSEDEKVVELKEKEEEQNTIQIIENEKAIDVEAEEFDNELEGTKHEEKYEEDDDGEQQENEADEKEEEERESNVEIDNHKEEEIERRSEIYEIRQTTSPLALPNSPEQEEEAAQEMMNSDVKEAEKSETLEEYNLSLLDEM